MDFKSLKKTNFHVHITGALSPDDLRSISRLCKRDISKFEPLESHMSFFDPQVWTLPKELTSTKKGLLEAIKIILRREREDNVVYLELTINPAGMFRRGLEKKDFMEAIINGIKYGKTLGIRCRIKFGVNRKDGPDSVQIVKEAFDRFPEEHRACIDLNGDEKQFPTKLFLSVFKKLSSEGTPISIHAGEFPQQIESLEKAINMCPKRIAHAIASTNNEKILGAIKKHGIIIEVCPISNIKTLASSTKTNSPIRKFLQYNIPIVLGSDDPAIFGSNLTSELRQLKQIGLSRKQIIDINKKSFSLI